MFGSLGIATFLEQPWKAASVRTNDYKRWHDLTSSYWRLRKSRDHINFYMFDCEMTEIWEY